MIFKEIKDLVKQVNTDLGEFCNTFLYKRKELNSGLRIGKRGELFSMVEDKNRDWAINSGGGTEVQYHIAFYQKSDIESTVLYGLGFNAQYVPFANDLSPVEYITPFTKSFYQIRDKAKMLFPHYYYVYGTEATLLNPKDGDYILFGNEINTIKTKDGFEISNIQYERMLNDLKNQFQLYVEIFTNRNIYIQSNMDTIKLLEELTFQKNKILYGPPGTGKTHRLKTTYFPLFTSRKKQLSSFDFKSRVRQYTWWQVIAAALYNNDQGTIVPNLADSKLIRAKHTPSLKYPDPNHIIWNILQRNPELFDKQPNSVWKINKQHIDDNYPMIKELHSLLADDALTKLEVKEDEKENYKFITFHQSFAYEDFIQGIKPDLSGENEEKLELNYKLSNGLFYDVCLKALELAEYESFEACFKDSKEGRSRRFEEIKNDPDKQVAIFIDEINRGNVSAIFGELITLIEDDKRIGAKNEMWADLPYSKKKFGVPSNLYIIGTMNTADRSIEALDTALRRRFTFEEMLPVPKRLESIGDDKNGNVSGINLPNLLTVINQRIEVLIDRDHTIGHAYFMNVIDSITLKQTFQNNIIPLLQEYFYGDYRKMEMVIGSYFFDQNKQKSNPTLFAVTEESFDIETSIYELRNIENSSFNIIDAMDVLLRNKTLDQVLPKV